MGKMKTLKKILAQLKTKKTKIASQGEAEIREIARLGQSFIVAELS